MVVPRFIVGLVGRGFIRAFRKFPIIFFALCVVGLVVGVSALFDFGESPSSRGQALFVKIIGVGCILFYGWLMLLFVWKILKSTWQEFCDRVFEDM
jgi:hypothetical protein